MPHRSTSRQANTAHIRTIAVTHSKCAYKNLLASLHMSAYPVLPWDSYDLEIAQQIELQLTS